MKRVMARKNYARVALSRQCKEFEGGKQKGRVYTIHIKFCNAWLGMAE